MQPTVPQAMASPASPEKLERRRVLLVEDEFLMRQALMTSLVDVGIEVEEAGSAAQALARLRLAERRIDAAIIDIGLPDRKGDLLAAELRTLYPDLPIVITSGYDTATLQRRFEGDALICFLGKPYVMRQLAQALHAVGVPVEILT